MSNTQLPAEVVEKILRARDALVLGDRDEAYHQLYGIANPRYDSYFPWQEMEQQIDYAKYYESEIKERRQVTEYATKLQQAQREIESLTNQLKNHAKVSNENMKLLRQENEDKDLLIEMYNVKHNTARTLLSKFISRHEAGLLPDRFIYDEIKKFLDGK